MALIGCYGAVGIKSAVTSITGGRESTLDTTVKPCLNGEDNVSRLKRNHLESHLSPWTLEGNYSDGYHQKVRIMESYPMFTVVGSAVLGV
jgi:hypothetical protein